MFALRSKSTNEIVTVYVTVDDSGVRPYVEYTLGTDSTDIVFSKKFRSDLEPIIAGGFNHLGSVDYPYLGGLIRSDLEIIELQVLTA